VLRPIDLTCRCQDDRSWQRDRVEAASVRVVSTPEAHEESQAVSLVFGLVVVLGLLFISVIAMAGPAWLGLLFGLVELAVAWRVTPPAGAQSLRVITGLMGALTVAWSVVRLFVS
jgi:hypothetical protein